MHINLYEYQILYQHYTYLLLHHFKKPVNNIQITPNQSGWVFHIPVVTFYTQSRTQYSRLHHPLKFATWKDLCSLMPLQMTLTNQHT